MNEAYKGIFIMNDTTFNILLYSKVFLLLASLIFAGCASIGLSTWNEEFEESHQRTIEFAPLSVPADYLGKIEGAYVYKALDSKKQTVVFRLPAKNDEDVKIYLDDPVASTLPGKTAMFHFNGRDKTEDGESDFPQDIHVFTSDMMTRFRYSCKEGTFDNEIDKSIGLGIKCDHDEKNCHGLSSSDSFKLGMRKAGYIIAVPLDVACLPITLPLGIIFLSTYCGPFGCP